MTYTNNELKTRYFRFFITNPNSGATGEAGGFIDSMKPQDYADYDPTSGTLAKNECKARGYLRWINLSMALSQFGVSYLEVNSLDGADALTAPTKIIFTMGFEQADHMYAKDAEGTEYTDINALKYYIGMALKNQFKGIVDVWDPTADSQGENPSGMPIGLTTPFLTAAALLDKDASIDSCVTIQEITEDTVTLIALAKKAPSIAQDGEKYFNTKDSKIYTWDGDSLSWGNAEDPNEDSLYIDNDGTKYYWEDDKMVKDTSSTKDTE